jgi:EAL domain-containing protein (putative c-di-GMP-specific phosphodiesterase class I)/FixJ family two-component response regulator
MPDELAFRLHPALLERGALVVEDSDAQRAHLVGILTSRGVGQVREAIDGSAALAQLDQATAHPAVLIIDLEMPGMDGIALIRELARRKFRIPLVIASSREPVFLDSVESMVRTFGLTVLGALEKPVDGTRLFALLEDLGMARNAAEPEAEAECDIAPEALQAAIEQGRIQPHFQVKQCMKSGLPHGAEALARWIDEDGRVLHRPDRFIPAAEKYALISALTLSMLNQVLASLLHWRTRGLQPQIALNLSPCSLDDAGLADAIIDAVGSSGIAPRQLIFEVTESTMTAMIADRTAALLRLRLRGFELSIDDYGSGFASLQQLSSLPFSELKIDRSFVSGAQRRGDLRTMLESSIEMGRKLGLRTVAEGVESQEDWALLARLGCDVAQGYLISRPLAASELPGTIARLGRRS